MIAERSNLPNNNYDLPDYYYEYLDTVHKYLGWPEWPSTEVPPQTEWWKSGLQVLPSHNRARHLLPYRSWVDTIGLPQSGKSTINKAIRTLGDEGLNVNANLSLHDQDQAVTVTSDAIFINTALVYPPCLWPDEDGVDFQVFEKDDPLAAVEYQVHKEIYWRYRVQNMFIKPGNRNNPQLIIGYRGPIDTTIFSYALASHKEDPKFTLPEDYRNLYTNLLTCAVVGSQLLVRNVDAIIITGIDQSEAQNRRKAEGKTNPGWVTDSPFYNDLSAWYGYWIEKVWPHMHDYFGTGLLVLDGTDKQDANIKKVTNYCNEIMSKWH